MVQTFYFTENMTHTFLRYAEKARIGNQKVLKLIDDLKKGLYEEDELQKEGLTEQLYSKAKKNIKTCCCIMLHIQCLADISDNSEPYDRFVNGWSSISVS